MRRKNSNLKLISAISVSIFSLAVLFMGTFAWFTALRDRQLATSNPFPISATAANFDKITIHTLNSTVDGTYKFNADDSHWVDDDGVYHGDPINFGTYTIMSRVHPILLIFHFREQITPDVNNPVSITAVTEETFVADGELDETTGNKKIKIEAEDNPLSSIIEFKSFSYANNTAGAGGTSAVTGISSYNSTTATFDYTVASLSGSDSFVNLTNNNGDITYNDFDDEKTFFSATSGNIRYVAIVFNYYVDALDYIYSYYLGSDAMERDYILFKCDWTMLII